MPARLFNWQLRKFGDFETTLNATPYGAFIRTVRDQAAVR